MRSRKGASISMQISISFFDPSRESFCSLSVCATFYIYPGECGRKRGEKAREVNQRGSGGGKKGRGGEGEGPSMRQGHSREVHAPHDLLASPSTAATMEVIPNEKEKERGRERKREREREGERKEENE